MLRDRCPEAVNLALLFCKAKTRWVNHVYDHFVGILLYELVTDLNGNIKIERSGKDVRKNAIRHILGLSKTNRIFDFDKSIDWEDLEDSEVQYWQNISNWVKWFQKKHLLIINQIDLGYTKEEILNTNPELKEYPNLYEFILKNHRI